MLEFYKRMMNDTSLPSIERENYRRMYEALLNKDKAEALKKELKPVEVHVPVEEDDCAGGGCKI